MVLAHLGMSGRLVLGGERRGRGPPHDHVVLRFDDGTVLRFNDARRFGLDRLGRERGGARAAQASRASRARAAGQRIQRPGAGRARSTARRRRSRPRCSISASSPGSAIYMCARALLCRDLAAAQRRHGAGRARRAPGARDPRRARARHRGRRVEPAGLCPGLGRAGIFPAPVGGLWQGGRACPGCDCGGHPRIVQGGRSTFYCAKRQR